MVGKGGFVVIEVGFGVDIGFEKFVNLKCCKFGLKLNCVVIVVIVCVLKCYGGGLFVIVGKFFDYLYMIENVDMVREGMCNLVRYIENIKFFGILVVVVINVFLIDIEVEYVVICEIFFVVGVEDVVFCIYYVYGGKGVVAFVNVVKAACEANEDCKDFKFGYEFFFDIKSKIEIVVKNIYKVDGVEFFE